MIQHTIATSRTTLPLTAVYGLVVCAIYAGGNIPAWTSTALLALSTLLMVELNNANSLIRVYSRMVSCCFLVLTLMYPPLLSSWQGSIIQLLFIITILLLFRTYQDRTSTGLTFYAYLSIGIASMIEAKMLCLVPLLWLLQTINIMSISIKSLCASLLALLLPYWFAFGYYVYIEQPTALIEHLQKIIQWQQPFDYSSLDVQQITVFMFTVILGITGTVHFLRNSHNDKIRTRMMYEAFITMFLCTAICIILQPQLYDILIRILIITVSPLIAHFFALTKTRITNIAFCVISILTVLITIFNLWMPSLKF